MNTNDVERRLEELADRSPQPAVPGALLDRLVELDGMPPARARLRALPGNRGRGQRRGPMALLGVAAALAITGGALLVGSATHTDPSPLPTGAPSVPTSAAPTTPEPSATISPATPGAFAMLPPAEDYALPATLGSWRRAYTFTDGWEFAVGAMAGGPPQPTLSWQNGEIVGLATRYRDQEQNTCVLRSKDGSSWSCIPLPTPTGERCTAGGRPCIDVQGLAIKDGHWVAVGTSDFTNRSSGQDAKILLSWTSTDGSHWSVQPSEPSPSTFRPGVNAFGSATGPALVATSNGFLMAGCDMSTDNAGSDGLLMSRDGSSWQPVSYATGSARMLCTYFGVKAANGFMTTGLCSSYGSTISRQCIAYSPDGETWTAKLPSELLGQATPIGTDLWPEGASPPSYVGGKWIVRLIDGAATAGDPHYYEATSADWKSWTVSTATMEDLVVPKQTASQGDYHDAVFSTALSNGYWAINSGPVFVGDPAKPDASAGVAAPYRTFLPSASKLYWSATGYHWQPMADAPPGWPVAVVETPTSVVAIMGADSASGFSTYSVWVAPKK